MALFPLPPYDLIDSSVIANTVGAGDATMVAQGKITVTGLGTPIYIRNVLSYLKTTGVAQTLQVTTIDTTAATVVTGSVQRFTLKRLSDNTAFTFDIVNPSTSVVTLKSGIVAALNAILAGPNGAAIVTAVSTGSNTLTITEVSGTGAFLFYPADTGITVVYTTPHVNSSGSLAEVQQYNPAISTGTLYTKFDCYVQTLIPEAGGMANSVRKGHIIIWVEQNDAQFAAFVAQFETREILGGTLADAEAKLYIPAA